jgi:hypothetical protein
MTSCSPASALLKAERVVRTANEEPCATDLLHVAFQTEVCIAFGQQFGIHRAVDFVAGRAAFPDRFVFENLGTALRGVAAKTHIIQREQGSAAAGIDGTFVRRVTIRATHLSLRHRMMVGQAELRAHVGMTLETDSFL